MYNRGFIETADEISLKVNKSDVGLGTRVMVEGPQCTKRKQFYKARELSKLFEVFFRKLQTMQKKLSAGFFTTGCEQNSK